jgi:hypothetical protein
LEKACGIDTEDLLLICPRKFSPRDMLDSSTTEEHQHEEGTVFPGTDRRDFAAGREG